MTDQGAVALLEEAAAALGPEDSELRVGLLSGLARALDLQGQRERGPSRAERDRHGAAARRPHRAGHRPDALVLVARDDLGRGDPRDADRGQALGDELGDTEIRAEAMAWRVPALVALCDLASARRAIPPLLEVAERTAQPFMLHVAEHYASAIALCDGRLDAAEAAAHRSHEWSRLLTGRDPSGVYGIQMFSVRRERGRLAELAPVVRVLAADPDRSGPWRPGLVALLAELGMEAEARRELDRLARRRPRPVPGVALARLARLPHRRRRGARRREVAALVYPELAPFAGGNVMIGHLVSCYGAADRYLGMLAATLGEDELAAAHFERALELNRAMGAGTWLAHTAYEFGRFLRARRGDRARATRCWPRPRRSRSGSGCRRCSRRVRALGAPAAAGCRTASPRARRRSSGSWRRA